MTNTHMQTDEDADTQQHTVGDHNCDVDAAAAAPLSSLRRWIRQTPQTNGPARQKCTMGLALACSCVRVVLGRLCARFVDARRVPVSSALVHILSSSLCLVMWVVSVYVMLVQCESNLHTYIHTVANIYYTYIIIVVRMGVINLMLSINVIALLSVYSNANGNAEWCKRWRSATPAEWMQRQSLCRFG